MLDSLWTRVLTALEGRIPETAIESWLRPCRVTAMDGDVIRVAAPNK
jgi:chromosomal replication initiation ATPase DnaA